MDAKTAKSVAEKLSQAEAAALNAIDPDLPNWSAGKGPNSVVEGDGHGKGRYELKRAGLIRLGNKDGKGRCSVWLTDDGRAVRAALVALGTSAAATTGVAPRPAAKRAAPATTAKKK